MTTVKQRKKHYRIDSKVEVAVEMITPEIATSLLERNNNNRKMRNKNVQALSFDIENGYWSMTGNAISLDNQGNLQDGQNRLQAIVNTDIAVPCVVVRGLPLSTMEVTDIGSSRSLGDTLKLEGTSDYNHLGATIRGVFLWKKYGNPGVSDKPSQRSLLNFWRSNPDDFSMAVKQSRKIRDQGMPMLMSIMSCALYLFNEINEEDTRTFAHMVGTGTYIDGSGLGDKHPIYHLRRQIIKDKQNPNPTILPNRKLTAGLIVKSWNCFIEGRDVVGSLRYRSGGTSPEEFPLISVPDYGTGEGEGVFR